MADQDGQRPGPAGAVRGSGLAMVAAMVMIGAAALVAVQLRPRGRPEDADVHEPARDAVPVPVLAECQLRKC